VEFFTSKEVDIQRSEDFQNLDTEENEASDYETREVLPWLKPPNMKASIFRVLKDMIGKDITKFAVPVGFNEPLSMLQKQSEGMEYHEILSKAHNCSDPALRMVYIAAFNIA
jgi:hypothetical protein